VTLWVDTITASITDYSRRHGVYFYRKMLLHRFFFNLAGSPLAVLAMGLVYNAAMTSGLASPANLGLAMALVAVTWFTVNTVTLAAAVSFWSNEPFWAIWKDAVDLYLLNFFGSAAFAGMIFLFLAAEYLHSVFASPW
jgi:hypothetical protein